MTFTFVTFVGLALFCQAIAACDESKKTVIHVDVYYETLCPDSRDFIVSQLGPNYDRLKDHLKLHLIPYGKAMYKKGENGERYQFSCQHGWSECAGNRDQSCAIHIMNEDSSMSDEERQTRSVKFVECYMSHSHSSNVLDMCMTTVNLDETKKNEIKTCAESVMGDELLAANGDNTSSLNPKLTFVPTIVLDHVYSRENQRQALSDFRGLICGLLSNDCNLSIC